MVQLSPPHGLGALERPEAGVEGQGSPQPDSPRPLTSLQLALNPSSATYQGYDTYIEDGLICLKHKIRNIEKKKLKLEDYKRRLRNGDKLNGDQQDAVSRYEEVVHNLAFAKELHATLGALTHDATTTQKAGEGQRIQGGQDGGSQAASKGAVKLLKAHRKAVLREQVVQMEAERAQLSMLLQMQHVLRQLQEPHVREGLAADPRHAHLLSAQELQSLIQLASLVGTERDAGMSLESQMTHVSTVYWDLLEGKATPVMGTTYKHMKELLLRLVDCGYFDQVLPAPSAPSCGSEESAHTQTQETPGKPESLTALVKGSAKGRPPGEFLNRHYLTDPNDSGCGQDETPPSSWKVEFLALKEQEPPDSWEAEFSERPGSPAAGQHKPWRGAAGFMPKIPVTMTASGGGPRLKRQRKAKDEQEAKPAVELVSPLEKDPVERRQQLEELMDQIRGSFTFMQDSLLDGAATPPHTHSMLCRPTPSTSTPIAHAEQLKTPPELLPKALCLVSAADGTDSLTNGEASLDQPPDPPSLERTSEEPTQETRSQGEREGFTSPPLYQREPSIPLEEQNSTKAGQQSPCNGGGPLTATPPQAFSTPPSRHSLSMADPAPFQKIHSVFKLNPSEVELKTDSTSFSQPSCLPYTHTNTHRYSTASTQTSSDLNLPDEDLQPETVFQSEGSLGNVGQMYSSRLAPPCYPRGTVRGMPRAGKSSPLSYRTAGTYRGGYEGFKAGLRSPGGGYSMRETASNLYSARDAGGLQAQRRGSSGSLAQRKSSSAGWSDSSQVSSPEGDGVYLLDPCHGGDSSLSVSLPPAAPQGLMPVHVYPLAQPLRVAYSAARTANFAPGTLDQPIGFDLLHTNQGEMFEMMSGRFCCPAAGTYVFIFHILKLAVNVPLYINLMRNEEVVVSAYANDGAPDHETASNHALLQLYQGDQVWLRLHRGAIYGSSWKYSTFSGFLLYQD